MIPSPAMNAISSQAVVRENPARPIAVLTPTQVIQETYASDYDEPGVVIRANRPFIWVENDSYASLEKRCEFITELAKRVDEMNLPRDQPLTVVSLDSKGLLSEWYVHEQFQKMGFTNLHWRIIDLEYADTNTHSTIQAFSDRANADVCHYINEQTYINRSPGQTSQALNDRSLGATIVLSLDAPFGAEADQSVVNDPAYLKLRGKSVDDIKQANAIYLTAYARTSDREAFSAPTLRCDAQLIQTIIY